MSNEEFQDLKERTGDIHLGHVTWGDAQVYRWDFDSRSGTLTHDSGAKVVTHGPTGRWAAISPEGRTLGRNFKWPSGAINRLRERGVFTDTGGRREV